MTSETYSGTEVTVIGLVAVVCAVVAYAVARRDLGTRGYSPWHLPPFIWSIFAFLFGPLGLIVFCIAWLTTRPRAGDAGLGSPPTMVPGRRGSAPGAEQFELGARRPFGFGSRVPLPPVHPPPPPGNVSPAGWHPDPGGRHQLRYWSGSAWTQYVSDGGFTSVDFN